MELLRKLGQRETWLYAAGIGLSIFAFVSNEIGTVDPEKIAPYIGIIATLIGPGAYAHVRRGEQRGKEVVEVATARLQAQALEGDEEEEGPWN